MRHHRYYYFASLFIVMLSGCGVEQSKHDEVVAQNVILSNENRTLKEQVESQRATIEKLEVSNQESIKAIEHLRASLEATRHNLDNLENSDKILFSRIPEIDDIQLRRTALIGFQDKFPSSDLLESANRMLKKVEEEILAAEEEQKRKEQEALEAERLKNTPIEAPPMTTLENFPSEYTERPIIFRDCQIANIESIYKSNFYRIEVRDRSRNANRGVNGVNFVVSSDMAKWLQQIINRRDIYVRFSYIVVEIKNISIVHGSQYSAIVRMVKATNGAGFGEKIFHDIE